MFEAVRRPLEVMFPPEKAVAKRLVEEAVVEKREVVVASVPVARPKSRKPRFAFVPNKLVEEAVVENIFVVVAEVPVARVKVKACKVVEAETNRSP